MDLTIKAILLGVIWDIAKKAINKEDRQENAWKTQSNLLRMRQHKILYTKPGFETLGGSQKFKVESTM